MPPALGTLAQQALTRAAATRPPDDALGLEERSVWRPDSWLLQNCWETLADAGAGAEALTVAKWAAMRQPMALQEALYRLAKQAGARNGLLPLIDREMRDMSPGLLGSTSTLAGHTFPQQLLYAAAAAAIVGDLGLSTSFLEKLDQTDRAWERIVASPELRGVLAEAIVRVGPHPLVLALLEGALRRFGDGGAELLLRVSEQIDPAISPEAVESRPGRILRQCVDTFRFGMLITLHSHRLAAAVLARAGRFDEVLNEVTTIANVQEARKLGGISTRQGDQNLLRQVKRPQADADIDFQVYTLREAVRAMPLRYIPREKRIELAHRLADLGMKSDGWTAAGAASTLAELGALKLAGDVVGHIAPTDPTRSEGAIALVRGLLAVDDLPTADGQAQKALAWARSLPGRNPERALTWGLAEAYLEFGHPQRAVALIDEWREETGMFARMRSRLNPSMSDDELRLKRLRLQALLMMNTAGPTPDESRLLQELVQWGPRLLDGEALVDHMADGLLRPLLAAGRTREAWALLPALQGALITSSGEKHATRVRQVSALLARQVRLAAATTDVPPDGVEEDAAVYATFLAELWSANAARGLWQTVHGLNGSLPLVLALEGPPTIAAIARVAHERGPEWA
jgi:hypothetical protein